MKPYGRLSAIWASFYSRDLYGDVAARWKGIGLLYLMLLLAICWLPSSARWFRGLFSFAATEAPAIARQVPVITIANGVMSANPPGRHVIRVPSDPSSPEGLVLIVDDTVDTIPSESPTELVVLARREFGTIRPRRGERRVWALTPQSDMVVTPQGVQGFVNSLPFWVPLVGYIGAVAGSVGFRFVQALVYGAITLAIARTRRIPIGYEAAVRLSVVAVTPVVIIRTLLWIVNADPAWYVRWPVAIAITLGYLVFAVRSLQPEATAVAPVE